MTGTYAAIAAAETANGNGECAACQQVPDQIAFVAAGKGQGAQPGGLCGHPIHMPVEPFLFVEMPPKAGLQPARSVSIAGIDIGTGREFAR